MRFRTLASLAAVLALCAAAAPGPAPAPAADAPAREGTAMGDPSKPFTHFRVGNKNVKSMLLEGNVLWVGTSGGVVRYDTSSGAFKLYDIQSGLLSNGIFHVGRVRGKLAVGTYGGGLSLLDEKTGKWD